MNPVIVVFTDSLIGSHLRVFADVFPQGFGDSLVAAQVATAFFGIAVRNVRCIEPVRDGFVGFTLMESR